MKLKLLVVALIATFVFAGCSDDDTTKKFSNEPTALEENDDVGQGIYKAVFIGSTGSILFNMDNKGDGKITATLVLDGRKYNLTTDGEFDQNGNFEDYFYGTMEDPDDIEIGFWAASDGDFEIYNVTIPGHPNIHIEAFKEYSDAIVKVFEGTYTGSKSGTINLVARIMDNGNGGVYGVGLGSEEGSETYNINAEIFEGGFQGNGDERSFSSEDNGSGNTITGTWSKGETETGTWTVKRTL